VKPGVRREAHGGAVGSLTSIRIRALRGVARYGGPLRDKVFVARGSTQWATARRSFARSLRQMLVAGALFASSHAAATAVVRPLKVCADPNNLPYSNAAEEGFENKIATLVANKLGRPLQFVWRAQRRGFLREGLNAGECDLITAIPYPNFMVRTTAPYYRSTYVFVSRPGEPAISSLDDPTLRVRKIGVQLIGDDGMNSPPAHALARRGIVENVRGFPIYGDYGKEHPGADIVDGVARGEIDVAAVWGPIAGYFAQRENPRLTVTQIEAGPTDLIPLIFDISMGVRKTDSDLHDAVQRALDDLEPEIRIILDSFHIPVVQP
jgi:mxaJ protein